SQRGGEMTPARGRPLATGDVIGGGAATVLGIAVLFQIRGDPDLPDGGPGPAWFPGIVGGLLIVLVLVLVVRALVRRTPADATPADAESDAEPDDTTPAADSPPSAPSHRRTVLNAIVVLAAIVLYIPLSAVLGFVITIALLLFGLMMLLG